MKPLSISRGLQLPINVATKRLSFLGTTGSGKSYAAMKLAEEMIAAGIQVVVIDVVGIWYGLRLAANGKSPGIQIPIFGGQHADIPIEPTAGAIIADLVSDRHISAVIDLSQMDEDTSALKFARDFGKQIYIRHKAKPSAVMIFLEECQEFIPENPGSQFEIQCLHAWKRVVKIGRNFGIGIGLISQRPQEISKKCLNLSECVFAFQMMGSHEREAMKKWIQSAGGEEKILDLLPGLEVGSPYVYSPRWLKVSGIHHISKRWTFDASATPEVGASKDAIVKPLSEQELKQFMAKMADTIERAKADDPKELRKQIAERDKKIVELQRTNPAPVIFDPARLQKEFSRGSEAVKRELGSKLKAYKAACEKALTESRGLVFKAAEEVKSIGEKLSGRYAQAGFFPDFPELTALIQLSQFIPPTTHDKLINKSPLREIPVSQHVNGSISGGSVTGGIGRKIMIALAQYRDGLNLNRLAIITGTTVSGHFNNTIGALRTSGYITAARVTPIQITQQGLSALGEYDALPVGKELRQYWIDKLGAGIAGKIFLVLIEAYPRPMSLEDLAGSCDTTVSGHFNNTVGSLRTMGLMSPARTPIKAVDDLFEE